MCVEEPWASQNSQKTLLCGSTRRNNSYQWISSFSVVFLSVSFWVLTVTDRWIFFEMHPVKPWDAINLVVWAVYRNVDFVGTLAALCASSFSDRHGMLFFLRIVRTQGWQESSSRTRLIYIAIILLARANGIEFSLWRIRLFPVPYTYHLMWCNINVSWKQMHTQHQPDNSLAVHLVIERSFPVVAFIDSNLTKNISS